jgi:hypothetical protein
MDAIAIDAVALIDRGVAARPLHDEVRSGDLHDALGLAARFRGHPR